MDSEFRKSLIYRLVIWGLLLIGLVVFGKLAIAKLTDPTFISLDDYVEYWSASRLNRVRGNPYNPDQLESLQLAAGRLKNVPIMMWNPPWTLALMMPLSWLPYPSSRVLWLLLNILILFVCVNWCWRAYGGDLRHAWIAWVVAFTFGPPLHLLKAGQITILLLLGVVGFLYFSGRQKWWLAGFAAGLITIKPHLLYLFGLALLVWALSNRKWTVLGGFAVFLFTSMGVAWAVNPALINQYLYAVTAYPPEQWATPTFGAVLRLLFGVDKFWLQFVPPVLGSLWFLRYWKRSRSHWDWLSQVPLLVLVSLMTSAYGWTFDYTVSLLAIIQVAVWASEHRSWSWAESIFLIVYVALDLVTIFSNANQISFWWMSSWLLASYLMALRLFSQRLKVR